MSELLANLWKLRDDARYEKLPESEQKAMENTLKEAEDAGASLRHRGFGGLPPSLALGIYRRDQYRCKRCGTGDDLSLHHKGGIESSKHWWRKKANNRTNLVVLCQSCHSTVHEEDS